MLNEVPALEYHSTLLGGSRSCRGTEIEVCARRWTTFERFGVLQVVLRNRTEATIELDRIQAHNKRGTRDHASLVRFDKDRPVPGADVHVKLKPGQQVEMSLTVHDPALVGNQVQLALSTVGRSLPMITVVDLDPPPPPPKPGEGLITLGLQGIAGAVWLTNPVQTDTRRAAPRSLAAQCHGGADGVARLIDFGLATACANAQTNHGSNDRGIVRPHHKVGCHENPTPHAALGLDL